MESAIPSPAGLGLQGIRKRALPRKELLSRLCQAEGCLNEAWFPGMTRGVSAHPVSINEAGGEGELALPHPSQRGHE